MAVLLLIWYFQTHLDLLKIYFYFFCLLLYLTNQLYKLQYTSMFFSQKYLQFTICVSLDSFGLPFHLKAQLLNHHY